MYVSEREKEEEPTSSSSLDANRRSNERDGQAKPWGIRNERERSLERDIETAGWPRERDTRHSCFIGPLRPTLSRATEQLRWWRRWRRWDRRVYEAEAKNEDEVNDIHGGYRILPARSHLWLPCLLLSLLLVRASLLSLSPFVSPCSIARSRSHAFVLPHSPCRFALLSPFTILTMRLYFHSVFIYVHGRGVRALLYVNTIRIAYYAQSRS